jgi:4-amino-4-deoxy-L-arabinose transferase-like glycosyltransferase
MPTPPTRRRLVPAALAVAAASCFLFFWRLADRDLWSSHEARAGMDAQTMVEDGAWGLPRLFDGRAELQKPPLYYWLVAGLARLRGGAVDAWAVRLPAALAALGCVLAVAAGLGALRRRPAAGLLAAAVLGTAVHFVWLARIARIDMPLTLTVTVAVGCFYLARREGRNTHKPEAQAKEDGSLRGSHKPEAPAKERAFLRWRFRLVGPAKDGAILRWRFRLVGPGGRRLGTGWLLLAGYLALALAMLLKGPIGFVLPAAVVAAHLLVEGDLRPSRWRGWGRLATDLGLWWGVPLVLILTAPWFFYADLATEGEFGRVFFWHHNLGRGLGGTGLRSNPGWFYLPQFASDFLPWSVLLLPALFASWRRGWLRTDPDARFGLTWFAAVGFVLSLARFKRADYLLPAYPGAALFLGCALRRWSRRSRRAGAAWLVPAVAGLTVLAWAVRIGWLLPAQESFRDYRAFAAAVRRLAPRPRPVVFFRTEAHALAFHLGRPLDVLVQWEKLRDLVARPGAHYVVMPPDSVRDCPRFLPGVRLEPVLSNTDLSGGRHERPLVLLRAAPAE